MERLELIRLLGVKCLLLNSLVVYITGSYKATDEPFPLMPDFSYRGPVLDMWKVNIRFCIVF